MLSAHQSVSKGHAGRAAEGLLLWRSGTASVLAGRKAGLLLPVLVLPQLVLLPLVASGPCSSCILVGCCGVVGGLAPLVRRQVAWIRGWLLRLRAGLAAAERLAPGPAR
jgi:hypothetical protein